MYDIIGDIHGYAEPLVRLLKTMGYRHTSQDWQHPDRKVIFLGDFVDRGPDQKAVIDIARTMVESKNALAIMGNHEFNAVSYATEDPHHPGEYLRRHTEDNRKHHQTFLDQLDAGSEHYHITLNWFKTLPLFLELDGIRVVHATWCPKSMAALAPNLTAKNQLKPSAWADANNKAHPAYHAIETLLKGYEIDLPNGLSFLDPQGKRRYRARLRWWEAQDLALKDAVIVPNASHIEFPDVTVNSDAFPGYDNKKLLFFGHYWWTGPVQRITPKLTCLDYSIAKADESGQLVAYRWGGEDEIRDKNFCGVRAMKTIPRNFKIN